MFWNTCSFLLVVEKKKKIRTSKPILFGPTVILVKGPDGAEQHFIYLHPQSLPAKVNSSNLRSYTEGFWVFAVKLGTKENSSCV